MFFTMMMMMYPWCIIHNQPPQSSIQTLWQHCHCIWIDFPISIFLFSIYMCVCLVVVFFSTAFIPTFIRDFFGFCIFSSAMHISICFRVFRICSLIHIWITHIHIGFTIVCTHRFILKRIFFFFFLLYVEFNILWSVFLLPSFYFKAKKKKNCILRE